MALFTSDFFAQLRSSASAMAACILLVVFTDNALIHIGYVVSPVEQRVEFSILWNDRGKTATGLLKEVHDQTGLSADRNRCSETLGTLQADSRFYCQFSTDSFEAWIDDWREFSSHLEQSGLAPFDLMFEDKSRLSIPVWLYFAFCIVYAGMAQFGLHGLKVGLDYAKLKEAIRGSPLPITAVILLGSLSLLAAGLFALLVANGYDSGHLDVSRISLESTEGTGEFQALYHLYLLKLFLLAPLWEESIFRGWLYERKSNQLAFFASASINAWAFTCAHAVPLALVAIPWISSFQMSIGIWVSWASYLIAVFLVGFLMFIVRDRYGSVSLCILTHAAINASAFAAIALILGGK